MRITLNKESGVYTLTTEYGRVWFTYYRHNTDSGSVQLFSSSKELIGMVKPKYVPEFLDYVNCR